MKKLYLIIVFFIFVQLLFSQNKNKVKIFGKVSYVSSQFTYIKFNSTKGIQINDTLYVKRKRKLIPKLIVNSLSSHSVAARIIGKKIKKGRDVIAFVKAETKVLASSKRAKKKLKKTKFRKRNRRKFNRINLTRKVKKIRGKISVSGYSNLSNITGATDYQNWRYSFSIEANKINNSGFSFSNYVVFNYRADKWHLLSENFSNAFRIYELAGKYELNKKTKMILGRKINSNITNVGAIDGLQLETKISNFNIGGVIGSRPDFKDYGFNIKLFQFGGYISRRDSVAKGAMQNTISLFQQMNSGTTDRRFVYLQHSNNIIRKVNLFFSSELDLFQKINGKNSNSLRLTSIYLSARYSPYRWVSFNTSYDARKNVIYYETFKNYAYRLLDQALRQGFRFRINLRPIRYVYASIYTGYRFRDNDIKPTKNIGGSITHSRVPFFNVSANVNFINLSTNYLSGNIWGMRLSKSFWTGLLTTSVSYRNINYEFVRTKSKLLQDVYSSDISFRISRMFSFLISFEGTYKEKESYSNIYLNLTVRF